MCVGMLTVHLLAASNQKPPGKNASFATKIRHDRKLTPVDSDEDVKCGVPQRRTV